MKAQEWILNLKVGDAVIVKDGGVYGTRRIGIVNRITPSGRIIVGKNTFSQDGTQYGGGSDRYWYKSIGQATAESIKAINEEQKIASVLKKMNDSRRITFEQAVEIERILNAQEVNHE